MIFFKVIKDENVIDIGFSFYKWNSDHNQMFSCNIEEAQFAGSYYKPIYYHDVWLKPIKEDLKNYETATIVEITEEEFEELKTLLDNGETISGVEEPPHEEPFVERIEPPIEEESKPLSISEMRALILEQQKQIEMLLKNINAQ